MLLTFLLVGLFLIIAIFTIALVWDCTHGISLFGNNMNAAIPELPANDRERNIPLEHVESPAVGEKVSECRTEYHKLAA